MRNKKGFTLVEITVAVAIIGILLALATPQMISARRRARTNICLANLKNIYGAKALWAMDNPLRQEEEPAWDELIPDYIEERPICPERGVYTIGTIREDPSCSISYHVLWGTPPDSTASERPDTSVDDAAGNAGGGGDGVNADSAP